jgi:hypothetical protein
MPQSILYCSVSGITVVAVVKTILATYEEQLADFIEVRAKEWEEKRTVSRKKHS